MLSVTEVGLSAIANARAGGFLVNIDKFKTSDADISNRAEQDLILADHMEGNIVFEDYVDSIEVVDRSAVLFTFRVPEKVVGGRSSAIGIFLESGELFAYGPLDPAYEKTGDYSLVFEVVVVADRLGEVVNVVLSKKTSLPSTAHVHTLVSPAVSHQNAIVVMDQQRSRFMENVESGLALKSGAGSNRWSFLGYEEAYRGAITELIDLNSFKVDPAAGGWWINDGEEVIVQITSGASTGLSRVMRYRKATSTFTSRHKSWPALTPSSSVAILRATKHQLPKRELDAPQHLVLGIGENSWRAKVGQGLKRRVSMLFIEATADGNGTVDNDAFLGVVSSQVLAFTNGKAVSLAEFAVVGHEFRAPAYPGATWEFYLMVPVTAPTGGTLSRFEVDEVSDNLTRRFFLPIVPDDNSWVVVYFNDEYVSKNDYQIEPTSILFNEAKGAGTVRLVVFGTYDAHAYTEIRRNYVTVGAGQTIVDLLGIPQDYKRVVVHLGGKLLSEDDYLLGVDKLTLLQPASSTMVLDVIYLDVMDSSEGFSPEGIDTGPVWVDPAGQVGGPNTLVPQRRFYLSTGIGTVFAVPNVPRTHLLLFIGGVWQHPDTYTVSDGFATLERAVPAGYSIEFLAFESISSKGSTLLCDVISYTSAPEKKYAIPTVGSIDEIMVFAGGVYITTEGIVLSASRDSIELPHIADNIFVDITIFQNVEHHGARTELSTVVDIAPTQLALMDAIHNKNNTIFLAGSVYQQKDTYTLTEDGLALQHNIIPYDSSIIATCISFVTGAPKSRLITREEAYARFQVRRMATVGWDEFNIDLRGRLACAIEGVLGLFAGETLILKEGSASDRLLAAKMGYTKTIRVFQMPVEGSTLSGEGVLTFNAYTYLQTRLRSEFNVAAFTISPEEYNTKYKLLDVAVYGVSQLGDKTVSASLAGLNKQTGACSVLFEATDGSSGSYSGSLTIGVTVELNPGLRINSKGAAVPLVAVSDIVDACCWTGSTERIFQCTGTGSTGPTVKEQVTLSNKPVITGTYPSEATDQLTVKVGAVKYVLGQSSALRVFKDSWVLDLRTTNQTLPVGHTEVEVTAVIGTLAKKDSSKREILVQVMDEPTIETLRFDVQKPIIRGWFNRTQATSELSVTINGWRYVLNSTRVWKADGSVWRSVASPPLTNVENAWSLDMASDPANLLAWDSHSITASIKNIEGITAASTETLVLAASTIGWDSGNIDVAEGEYLTSIDLPPNVRATKAYLFIRVIGGWGSSSSRALVDAGKGGSYAEGSAASLPDGMLLYTVTSEGEAVQTPLIPDQSSHSHSFYLALYGVSEVESIKVLGSSQDPSNPTTFERVTVRSVTPMELDSLVANAAADQSEADTIIIVRNPNV